MGKIRPRKTKKVRDGREALRSFTTALKVGDVVMVLGGGNSKKDRAMRGKTGKIMRFLPKSGRVVVEGLNMVKRHQRARTSQDSSGIIEREGSIAISNVMYYSGEFKKPLRIRYQRLQDGRKVRGVLNPKTKAFQQIDAS